MTGHKLTTMASVATTHFIKTNERPPNPGQPFGGLNRTPELFAGCVYTCIYFNIQEYRLLFKVSIKATAKDKYTENCNIWYDA